MRPIESKVSPLLPLLKFPLLIQMEIIRMMEPKDQYVFSKCSKRTHGAVKISIPKKQNPEIWIHPDSSSKSVRFYLMIADARFYLCETKTYFPDYDEIDDYSCDLFSAPSDDYLELSRRRSSVKSASYLREFKKIHENLCNLFSAPLEVYVKASCRDIELLIKPELFPAGTIWKSILPKVGYALDQFSKLHPNQDFIFIDGSYTQDLLPGHTFLDAKNLMVSNTSSYCPYSILSLFQGEHLFIENGLIPTFFLEVFVKKWMKMKIEKLKTAIVKLHSESVVEDLKFEKFSGRCRHYEYNSIIKSYYKFPNGIFDISEGWEVRRESDGKVATIKVTRDYFMFLVW